MRKNIITTLAVMLTFVGYAQQKIIKLQVHELGEVVHLKYNPVVISTTYKGLTIKVIPESPENLNNKFINESHIDGRLNYAFYSSNSNSYFLKKKSKHKEIKSDLKFLLDGLNWLNESDLISKQEFNELLSESKNDNRGEKYFINQATRCNPYYFGSNYLSVFKIIFTNNTNADIVFDASISIQTGENNLGILSEEYINTLLKNTNSYNPSKSLNLKRHNLPNNVVIPAKSTCNYYI